jgi:hypothetical protein
MSNWNEYRIPESPESKIDGLLSTASNRTKKTVINIKTLLTYN